MKSAAQPGLILPCGRYESDRPAFARPGCRRRNQSRRLSVLSGGELRRRHGLRWMRSCASCPACSMIRSRRCRTVLSMCCSIVRTTRGLEEYHGVRVPDVLLGGHHAEIEAWRRREALRNTWHKRPDLIVKARKNKMLSRADGHGLQVSRRKSRRRKARPFERTPGGAAHACSAPDVNPSSIGAA